MKSIHNGFTMMELMIVIAIIGILAAIAIPVFQDYIGRAQMAEALSLASGQKATVAEFYSANNICPNNTGGSAQAGGIARNTAIAGKYVQSVTVGDGSGTITIGSDTPPAVCQITALMRTSGVNGDIAGRNLILKMAVTSGAFQWGCTSNAYEKYLPTSCQP